MNKSPLLVPLMLFSWLSPSLASAPQPIYLSASLSGILQQHQAPGMATVVVHNGQITAYGVAGLRKRGNSTRMTIQDRFHLGSCTKAMTATLLALLVEEKKMSWSTTLGQVFPEYKTKMHSQWRGVTLAQLLTNRSGAPTSLDRDGLWGKIWNLTGPLPQQRLELLKGVTKHAPEALPGTKFIYSNAGFTMAGSMAEKITGKSWETLMQERIFKPLGMTSAGFGPPGQAGKITEPRGHNDKGVAIEPGRSADNPQTIGPAGTVHASLADWAKFIALHLRGEREGWKHQGKMLLASATFKKLHTPPDHDQSGYAYGWGRTERPWAGGVALSHAGSNTLWFVVCWLAPAKNAAVLVATNQAGKDAEQAADQVAGMAIKETIAKYPVLK